MTRVNLCSTDTGLRGSAGTRGAPLKRAEQGLRWNSSFSLDANQFGRPEPTWIRVLLYSSTQKSSGDDPNQITPQLNALQSSWSADLEITGRTGIDYVRIDVMNFGPADYALNLGLAAPDRLNPRVLDGLQRTIDAARRAGEHAICDVGMG